MSEYNPVVINWAGRAKPAGLSFLIVNLGVPWTLPVNQCSRGIVLNVCCSSSLEGNCHTYSLEKLKNPYRRDFSLRVATLVMGGNQYLCLHENVPLLRHSNTILWYWYGITGLIDKPRCGNMLRKCVDYNRISWHEKYAKKPHQTWEVNNKSHSNQSALNIFGSTRIELALNEQRRLITSIHNAKVIYIFHWSLLQLPTILMVGILDWITVCIVDVCISYKTINFLIKPLNK